METLRRVASEFVRGRPSDMLGIVSFARTASVVTPLTLDHAQVLDGLKELQVVPSQDQDGTAIGYAIYKTATLIAATEQFMKGKFEIKGAAILLVTDGLQDPNPLDNENSLRNQDIPEAADYAKEQKIKLYIINIDPSITMDQFAPHRNQMRTAAESTGGNCS